MEKEVFFFLNGDGINEDPYGKNSHTLQATSSIHLYHIQNYYVDTKIILPGI